MQPTPEMILQMQQSMGMLTYHWPTSSYVGHPLHLGFPTESYPTLMLPASFATSSGSSSSSSSNDIHGGIEMKIEKNRERNREHAKRTRMRKKAVLDGMKVKLLELQREAMQLKNLMDERNTASILLAFSSTDSLLSASSSDYGLCPEAAVADDDVAISPIISAGGDIIEQLRTSVREEIQHQNNHREHLNKRTRRDGGTSSLPSSCASSMPPSEESSVNLETLEDAEIDGLDSDNEDVDISNDFQTLPESTVNWKTGTVKNAQGNERRLSDGELYQFRKDRNRIHAKMTRDRKKLFTSRMQKLIATLERDNALARSRMHMDNPPSQTTSQSQPQPQPQPQTPRHQFAKV